MIGVQTLYASLLDAHGPQHWWPAEDAFEIITGALLVQRTAWRNVESAVAELRRQSLLDPEALAVCELSRIEQCIRGAGFYRTKASRLRQLARFVIECGGIEELSRLATPGLRTALLERRGIGAETADTILVYAFDRPAVIVDEYLRRLVGRLSPSDTRWPDASLRDWIRSAIDDAPRLSELHALVVAHGKASCGPTPRCAQCEISSLCRTGRAASDA